MSVAVVTDSTAYLDPAVAASLGIGVVPLHVVVGGQEFREGVDITPDQVAEALREFRPVTTSRPAPAAFAEAYQAAANAGATAIVSIHLSGQLSSTIGSAQLAAADASVPVTVVDSGSMGLPMAYAVLAAAQAAADGADARACARLARTTSTEAFVAFYVDSLEYLRRGGRIGAASAMVGSALAIKPILTLADGVISPLEKVRTTSRALSRMADRTVSAGQTMRAAGDQIRAGVMHLAAPDRAAAMAAQLRSRLDLDQVPVVELGAVVGVHVGPGTLVATVVPDLAPVSAPSVADDPAGPSGATGSG